jgi:8-oxo-dGTP diphosphatase
MDRFVVGFPFNEDATVILLVRKLRPKWQEGLLNGIGGKIEAGETPREAMLRESKEETGLDVAWQYKGVMTGENNDGHNFECHIYYTYTQHILEFEQKEDEPLCLYHVKNVIGAPNTVNNLQYLIPFGMYRSKAFITLKYPA